VYLWHYPIFVALAIRHRLGAIVLLGGYTATVLIAAASSRYVEAPFLRLKQRFG
jgi:peptidoglycan/LPS O-acetylase OafA/YrhL